MGRKSKAEYPPDNEYVGHMYGDWEIISTNYERRNGKAYFLCRCHCACCSQDGQKPIEKFVSHYYMYTGKSKGCGRANGFIRMSTDSNPSHRILNKYDMTGTFGVGFDGDSSFYFDKEDFDIIKQYTWRIGNNGYVRTAVRKNGVCRFLQMHRLVMGIADNDFNSDGVVVDHINHNKVDNRKANLRLASIAENALNKEQTSFTQTGVRWQDNKWLVRFHRNGKEYYGGMFDDYGEAIRKRVELEPDKGSSFQYVNSL